MARPGRCRLVCPEPEQDCFEPCGVKDAEPLVPTVSEYETIRLIN